MRVAHSGVKPPDEAEIVAVSPGNAISQIICASALKPARALVKQRRPNNARMLTYTG
jgi:hypothetical protein